MASLLRKRFVYDEKTKEMVQIDFRPREQGVLIMGDLPDFVSPVDGTVVHGRAGLREHDRRNGTTNIADYKGAWEKKLAERAAFASGRDQDRRRTEAVVRAYETLARK